LVALATLLFNQAACHYIWKNNNNTVAYDFQS
jgi:hypothetical protein